MNIRIEFDKNLLSGWRAFWNRSVSLETALTIWCSAWVIFFVVVKLFSSSPAQADQQPAFDHMMGERIVRAIERIADAQQRMANSTSKCPPAATVE